MIVVSRFRCADLQQLGEVTHHCAEPRCVGKQRVSGGEVQFGAVSYGDAVPLGTSRARSHRSRRGITHQARSEERRAEPLGDLSFQGARAKRLACRRDGIECFPTMLRQTSSEQFHQMAISPRRTSATSIGWMHHAA